MTTTAASQRRLALTRPLPGRVRTDRRASEVIHETFFDDFTFETCGVETDITQTQRTTIKTFPDGSRTVHRVAE